MAKTIKEQAHDLAPYIIGIREDIHRHPEASMQEFRTTDLIAAEMERTAYRTAGLSLPV